MNASMRPHSSSQLPMALALNFPVTPRFHDTPTSSSTFLPSTLLSQHQSIHRSLTSTCKDGSEANLPRPRGSSWRNASIFLCNPNFNASGRARARALAASSSSKYATIYRRWTRIWADEPQRTSFCTKWADLKRRSAIHASAARSTRT